MSSNPIHLRYLLDWRCFFLPSPPTPRRGVVPVGVAEAGHHAAAMLSEVQHFCGDISGQREGLLRALWMDAFGRMLGTACCLRREYRERGERGRGEGKPRKTQNLTRTHMYQVSAALDPELYQSRVQVRICAPVELIQTRSSLHFMLSSFCSFARACLLLPQAGPLPPPRRRPSRIVRASSSSSRPPSSRPVCPAPPPASLRPSPPPSLPSTPFIILLNRAVRLGHSTDNRSEAPRAPAEIAQSAGRNQVLGASPRFTLQAEVSESVMPTRWSPLFE